MTARTHTDFVVLTVYMRPEIAEVSRVLQTLVLQPLRVERFSARLVPVDVSGVGGLDGLGVPVMKLVVTGTVTGPHEVERAVKALNKLTQVYKVRTDGE
ncbi:MAG: hypothetical protein JWR55_1530 [Aeromicrobium sp.]|jgi:hypothetical protein|nr:hypothetical protein [Aeromicrobium sp.]